MTNCSTIMAILQENRVETAAKVQSVLSEHGCDIRVRLGLHDSEVGTCSNTGLILLQVCGECNSGELERKLMEVPNVKIKTMVLDF